jgi:hypothetical protein
MDRLGRNTQRAATGRLAIVLAGFRLTQRGCAGNGCATADRVLPQATCRAGHERRRPASRAGDAERQHRAARGPNSSIWLPAQLGAIAAAAIVALAVAAWSAAARPGFGHLGWPAIRLAVRALTMNFGVLAFVVVGVTRAGIEPGRRTRAPICSTSRSTLAPPGWRSRSWQA